MTSARKREDLAAPSESKLSLTLGFRATLTPIYIMTTKVVLTPSCWNQLCGLSVAALVVADGKADATCMQSKRITLLAFNCRIKVLRGGFWQSERLFLTKIFGSAAAFARNNYPGMLDETQRCSQDWRVVNEHVDLKQLCDLINTLTHTHTLCGHLFFHTMNSPPAERRAWRTSFQISDGRRVGELMQKRVIQG